MPEANNGVLPHPYVGVVGYHYCARCGLFKGHQCHGESGAIVAPQPDTAGPEVPQAHKEAAARFRKMFVPVRYEARDSDSIELRMLYKIYNITGQARHEVRSLTEHELREVHSAAYAGIEPEPVEWLAPHPQTEKE